MTSKSNTPKKRIVLGITGSIAAYKSADLVSELTKAGHDVRCVMTRDAQHFVSRLVLQTLSRNPVLCDLFEDENEWQPGHIALADSADLLLIAPATANIIAQLSYGLAGDALTCIALATRAPIVIAPAMNGKMWQHPATQENVNRLISRGQTVVGPDSGLLACGYEGEGRLEKIDVILDGVEKILRKKK